MRFGWFGLVGLFWLSRLFCFVLYCMVAGVMLVACGLFVLGVFVASGLVVVTGLFAGVDDLRCGLVNSVDMCSVFIHILLLGCV